MFRGRVKASVRVRHKLGPLRVTSDYQALCLGLTVDYDLECVRWLPNMAVRNEVNGCAVEFDRRPCYISGNARGKIKSIERVTTLQHS